MCKPCKHEQWRDGSKTHKGRQRRRHYNMKFLYGIAVEEYEALFIMQDGLCAICEQPERQQYWKTGEVKSLCIDHDHLTGKVRALLCSNCNGGLGLFHDDPAKLLAAADYIRSFRSA